MSEIKKNIETCRGEDVLAEVSAAPQDPHFGSLVNEAFDPLKQQAAAQEGWDGYSEVIAQHKPYTFASAIIQMKSNLLLLLRALWQFPFGSGTLRSLADMWQHYITRLQGNETYGIPSRLSSLTDLPSAPLLLADRKISNGSSPNDGIPDGTSLARLLAADYSEVTKLVDDTQGWTLLHSMPTVFPNAKDITLRCKEIICKQSNYPYGVMTVFGAMDNIDLPDVEYIGMEKGVSYGYTNYGAYLTTSLSAQTIRIPKLKKLYNSTGGSLFGSLPNCTKIELPSLADIRTCGSGWLGTGTGTLCLSSSAPECLEVITNIGGDTNGNNASADYRFIVAPKLQKLVLGGVLSGRNDKGLFNTTSADLIDIEIGGAECSLDMRDWNPTNALDASLDTLVKDEDCHNNLEQFLKNFRTYIALRLADNGSGLTLTLSQAVYDAIKDESHLFVFDEGTMTIYAYLTNIKHWTVTK